MQICLLSFLTLISFLGLRHENMQTVTPSTLPLRTTILLSPALASKITSNQCCSPPEDGVLVFVVVVVVFFYMSFFTPLSTSNDLLALPSESRPVHLQTAAPTCTARMLPFCRGKPGGGFSANLPLPPHWLASQPLRFIVSQNVKVDG